jgi:hypothetical protein
MSDSQYDYFSHRTLGVGFKVWAEYHSAIKTWLSDISKWRGGRIYGKYPVIYSTPELAFARDIAPLNQGNPDLPMFSFFLSSVSFNKDRWFVPSLPGLTWEKEAVGQDADGNPTEWRLYFKSLPYDLNYSISLWHKEEFEAEYADYDILSRFRPLSYVQANGADSPIHIESISDSSELEPGVAADRRLRRTYSIRVEGWLPLPWEQVSRIENISSTLTDVDITDISQEDWDKLIEEDSVFTDSNLQNLHEAIWATGDAKDYFRSRTRTEAAPGVIIPPERDETIKSNVFQGTESPAVQISIRERSKITLGGNMILIP